MFFGRSKSPVNNKTTPNATSPSVKYTLVFPQLGGQTSSSDKPPQPNLDFSDAENTRDVEEFASTLDDMQNKFDLQAKQFEAERHQLMIALSNAEQEKNSIRFRSDEEKQKLSEVVEEERKKTKASALEIERVKIQNIELQSTLRENNILVEKLKEENSKIQQEKEELKKLLEKEISKVNSVEKQLAEEKSNAWAGLKASLQEKASENSLVKQLQAQLDKEIEKSQVLYKQLQNEREARDKIQMALEKQQEQLKESNRKLSETHLMLDEFQWKSKEIHAQEQEKLFNIIQEKENRIKELEISAQQKENARSLEFQTLLNKLQQYELMSSQALQTNIVGQEFLELSVDELNSSTNKEEKEGDFLTVSRLHADQSQMKALESELELIRTDYENLIVHYKQLESDFRESNEREQELRKLVTMKDSEIEKRKQNEEDLAADLKTMRSRHDEDIAVKDNLVSQLYRELDEIKSEYEKRKHEDSEKIENISKLHENQLGNEQWVKQLMEDELRKQTFHNQKLEEDLSQTEIKVVELTAENKLLKTSMQSTVDRLNVEIDELKEQIRVAEESNQNLQRQRDSAQQEAISLKVQLDFTEGSRKKVEQELGNITIDFQAQLAKVNEEKQAVLKEIFLEKEHSIQQIEKVELEKRKAFDSIRNYEAEVAGLRDEINTLNENAQQLRSRIQLLQKQQEEMRIQFSSESESLKSQQKNLEIAKDLEISSIKSNYETKIQTMQKTTDQLNKELESTSSQNERKLKEINELNERLEKTIREKEILEKMNQQLQQNIQKLIEANNTEKQTKLIISDLQRQIRELQEDKSLQIERMKTENEIKLSQLEAQLTDLRKREEISKKKLSEKEEEISQMKKEHSSELLTKENTFKQSKKETIDLKNLLEKLEKSKSELESEKKYLKSDYEEELNRYSERIKKLEQTSKQKEDQLNLEVRRLSDELRKLMSEKKISDDRLASITLEKQKLELTIKQEQSRNTETSGKLTNEIKSLTETKKQLSIEKSQLEEQVNNLNEQIKRQMEQLKVSSQEKSQREEKIKSLNEELARQSKMIEQLNVGVSQLEVKVKGFQEDSKKALENSNQLSREKSLMEITIKQLNEDKKKLVEDFRRISQEKSQLEANLKSSTEELQRLSETMKQQAGEKIKSLLEENRRLSDVARESNAEVLRLTPINQLLEVEKSKMQNLIKQQEDQLKQVTEEAISVKESLKQIQQEKSQLEAKLRLSIEENSRKIQELKNEVLVKEENAKKLSSEINKLNQSLKQSQGERFQADLRIQTLENSVKFLDSQLKSSNEELTRSSDQLKALKRSIDEKSKQFEERAKSLIDENTKLSESYEEIYKEKSLFEIKLNGVENQLKTLQEEKSSLSEINKSLSQQNKQLSEELDKLSSESEEDATKLFLETQKLSSQMTSLSSEKSQSEEKVKSLLDEIKRLSESLSKLSAEKNKTEEHIKISFMEENKKLSENLRSLTSEKTSVEQKLKGVTEELRKVKENIQEFSIDKQQLEAKLKSQNEDIRNLNEQIKEMRRLSDEKLRNESLEIQKLTQNIREISLEKSQLEFKIKLAENQSKSLENQLKSFSENSQKLLEENRKLNALKFDLESKLNSLTIEKKKVDQQLANAQVPSVPLVKEKIEVVPVSSEPQEDTKSLHLEISRLQQESNQLKIQLSQQVDKASIELSGMKKMYELQQSQLNEANTKIQELELLKNQLELRIAEIETQNRNLLQNSERSNARVVEDLQLQLQQAREEKEIVMREFLREQSVRDDLKLQLEQEKKSIENNNKKISDLENEISTSKSKLLEEIRLKDQILYDFKRTKMENNDLGNSLKQEKEEKQNIAKKLREKEIEYDGLKSRFDIESNSNLQKISQLNGSLAKLDQQYKSLLSDYEISKGKSAQLEKSISELRSSYERQVQQYRSEIAKLQQPILPSPTVSENERNELITKLRAENSAAKAEVEKQFKEYSLKEQNLRGKLTESSNELEKMRSELSLRNSTIEQLQEELKELRVTFDQAMSAKSDVDRSMKSMRQNYEVDLKSQVDTKQALESQLRSQQILNQKLEGEVQSLQSKMKSANDELSRLKQMSDSTVDLLKQELLKQRNMYEDELRKKQQLCVRLESENRSLESQINESKLTEVKSSVSADEEQSRKRLESELNHIKSLNTNLTQMERVKNEQVLQKQVQQYQKEKEDLSKQLATEKKSNTEFRARVFNEISSQNPTEGFAQLKQELESLNTRLANEGKMLNEMKNQLQNEVKDKQAATEKSKHQELEFEQEKRNLVQEMESLKQRENSLRSQKQALEEQVQQMVMQLEKDRFEKTRLVQQLENLTFALKGEQDYHNKEVEKLKGLNKSLQEEMQQLVSSKSFESQTKASVTSLQVQIQQLEKQNNEQLKEMQQSFEAKQAQLEADIREAINREEATKKELMLREKELKSKEEALKSVQEELKRLKTNFAQQEASWKTKITESFNRNQQLSSELKWKDKELLLLKQQVNENNNKTSLLSSQLRDLTDRDGTIKQLQEELQDLKMSFDQITIAKVDADKTIKQMKQSYEEELQRVKQLNTSFEEELKIQRKLNQSLELELKASKDKLKSAIPGTSEQISQVAEKELAELRLRLQASEKAKQEIESSKLQLELQLNSMIGSQSVNEIQLSANYSLSQQQVQSLKQQVESEQVKQAKLLEEQARLISLNDGLSGEVSLMKKKLNDLIEEKTKIQDQLNSEIKRITYQLQQSSFELSNVKQQLSLNKNEHQKEKNELQATAQMLKAKIESLSEEKDQLKRLLDENSLKFKRELESQRSESSRLESSNRQLQEQINNLFESLAVEQETKNLVSRLQGDLAEADRQKDIEIERLKIDYDTQIIKLESDIREILRIQESAKLEAETRERQFKQRISQLESERSHILSESEKKLEKSIETLRAEIQIKDQNIKQLQSEIISLRKTPQPPVNDTEAINRLTLKLQDAQNELSQTRSQLQQSEVSRSQIETDLVNLRVRLDRDAKSMRIGEAEKQQLTGLVSQLELQITQLKRDNEALAKISSLETPKLPEKPIVAELEQLRKTVQVLTEENKQKSLIIQGLEKERSSIQQTDKQVLEKQQMITELQLRLEFEGGEKEKLIGQMKHLQSSLQQMNSRISQLESELSDASLKLSENTQKLTQEFQLEILQVENEWRERIALSADAKKVVEEQTNSLKIENSILQERIKEKLQTIIKLESTVYDLRSEISELKIDFENNKKLEEEHKKLIDKYNQVMISQQSGLRMYEELKLESQQSIKSRDEHIQQLKLRSDNQSLMISQLNNELQALSGRVVVQRETVQATPFVDKNGDVDRLKEMLAKIDAEKVEYYRKFLQEELTNSKLQQELEQTKHTLAGIQKELIKAKHKQNTNTVVAPNPSLATPMKSLIRSSQSSEPRIEENKNEIRDLKSKIEEQKRHYKERIKKLKSEMEVAKQGHSQLLVQIELERNENNRLKEKVMKNSFVLEMLKNQGLLRQQYGGDLVIGSTQSTDLKKLEDTNRDLQQQLSYTERVYEQAQQKVREVLNENEQLKIQCGKLANEISEIQGALTSARKSAEIAHEEKKLLLAELFEEKQYHQETSRKLEEMNSPQFEKDKQSYLEIVDQLDNDKQKRGITFDKTVDLEERKLREEYKAALIQELSNQKEAYEVVAKQLEESKQQLLSYEAKINAVKENYEKQMEEIKQQQELALRKVHEDQPTDEDTKQKFLEVVDQLVKQQEQIKFYINRSSQLEKLLASQQSQMENYQHLLSEAQNSLKISENTNQQLQSLLQQMNAKFSRLESEQKLNSSKLSLDSFSQTTSTETPQMNLEQQTMFKQTQVQLSEISEQLQEERNVHQKLFQKIGELEQAVRIKDDKIVTDHLTIANIERQLTQRDLQLNEYKKIVEQMKQQEKQRSENFEREKSALSELEVKLRNTKALLDRFRSAAASDVKIRQKTLFELEQKIKNLNKERLETSSIVTHKDLTIQQLRNEITKTKEDFKNVQNTKNELISIQNKLNRELEILKKQFEGVSSELTSSKLQYDSLQKKFDEEKKSFYAKQHELLQTIETLGNTTLTNSEIDLQASLRSADHKFSKLTQQVNNAKAQLTEELNHLKDILEREMKTKINLESQLSKQTSMLENKVKFSENQSMDFPMESPRAQLIIEGNETFVSKEEHQKMTISMITGPDEESLNPPTLSESLLKAAQDRTNYFSALSDHIKRILEVVKQLKSALSSTKKELEETHLEKEKLQKKLNSALKNKKDSETESEEVFDWDGEIREKDQSEKKDKQTSGQGDEANLDDSVQIREALQRAAQEKHQKFVELNEYIKALGSKLKEESQMRSTMNTTASRLETSTVTEELKRAEKEKNKVFEDLKSHISKLKEIHGKKRINASTQTSSIVDFQDEVTTIEQPFQIASDDNQNPPDLIEYYDSVWANTFGKTKVDTVIDETKDNYFSNYSGDYSERNGDLNSNNSLKMMDLNIPHVSIPKSEYEVLLGAKSKYEITIQENTRLILRISELHNTVAELNEKLAVANEQIIEAVIGDDDSDQVKFELSEPLSSSSNAQASPISKMKSESETPKVPKLKIPVTQTSDKASSPRSFRELADYQLKVEQQEHKIVELERQVAEQQKRISDLQFLISDQHEKIGQQWQAFTRQEKTVSHQHQILTDLKQTISQQHQTISDQDQDFLNYKEKIQEQEELIFKLKNENEDLQSKIFAYEEEISHLQNQTALLKLEVKNAKETLEFERSEMNIERRNFREKSTEDFPEILLTQLEKESYERQISILEEEVLELNSKLEKENLLSSDKDQMIEDLTRDNKTLRLQIDSQQSCINEYQQIIDEMPSFSHQDDLKVLLDDYQSMQEEFYRQTTRAAPKHSNGNANGVHLSKTMRLLESIHNELLEEQEMNAKTIEQLEMSSIGYAMSSRIPDNPEDFTLERLQKELSETQKLVAEIDEDKEFA